MTHFLVFYSCGKQVVVGYRLLEVFVTQNYIFSGLGMEAQRVLLRHVHISWTC